MRFSRLRLVAIAAVVAAMGLAGCLQPNGYLTTAEATLGANLPLLQERTAHTRLLYIYVGGDNAPAAVGTAHVGALALSLRDLLRQKKYDVRGAESVPPTSEGGLLAGRIAQTIATGGAVPAAARPISYLHPNAPRLLLFVHLQENLPSKKSSRGPVTSVGAFLADSTDGAILWSGRTTTRDPLTDTALRQLANRLLKTLPSVTRTAAAVGAPEGPAKAESADHPRS